MTSKKPWPTKDAMQQIYEKNLWGSATDCEFYSGDGSHNSEIVAPYLEAVQSFLTSFENPISVCDLGCGDFNIGKELVTLTKNYTAIDIVPSLIEHNRAKFKEANVDFQCLDIAEDDLPLADCVILRQVLQHLSNQEVTRIADKLSSYKYVILTEHVPIGDFEPNKDIISGQGIRLKKQSGVDLEAAPFNFSFHEKIIISNVTLPKNKGVIKTVLYIVR